MPTYSYSGEPGSSAADEVRFLINDVASPWRLSDEEIAYILTGYPKVDGVFNYSAAIIAATRIATYYSSLANKTVGSLTLRYSEQQKKYLDMIEQFRQLANTGPTGKQTVGGAPQLFGGGESFLGPDDSPEFYSE